MKRKPVTRRKHKERGSKNDRTLRGARGVRSARTRSPTQHYLEVAEPQSAPMLTIPTTYTREYHPEHLRRLIMLGLTPGECAEFFNVSTPTLEGWIKHHPEMEKVARQAHIAADADVAVALHKRAVGFTVKTEKIFCTKDGDIIRVEGHEYYPPDATAAIFWLRARQRELWNKAFEAERANNVPPAIIEVQLGPTRGNEDRSYRGGYEIEGKVE